MYKNDYTPDVPDYSKRIFAFGYGSLMYSSGINGRGMSHEYANDELTPCIIKGVERGMYAVWEPKVFYGIIQKENSIANGTIFEIHSRADQEALNLSERCDINGYSNRAARYTLKDVSDMITMSDGRAFSEAYPDAQCFSYVIIERARELENGPRDRYERHVDRGMTHLGKKFVREFIATSTNK